MAAIVLGRHPHFAEPRHPPAMQLLSARPRRGMLPPLHLMSFYSWLLGRPLVYEHIRPFVVGGVDASLAFQKLRVSHLDAVLDVGCGTGDALNHLRDFARYRGIDPDPVAIAHARKRFRGRAATEFRVGFLEPADLAELAPTRAVLGGVLHHLTDTEAHSLLSQLRAAPSLARVVTLDIVYLQGQRWSNLLAALDRGPFCRRRESYESLARAAGWTVTESSVVRSHPTRGRALYLTLTLEP